MNLSYLAPSGETFADFKLAELLPMVRKGGKSYWGVGSGSGLISWGEIGDPPSLGIRFVPRRGFQLIFSGADGSYLAAEPTVQAETAKWVEIFVGGERTQVSTRQIVDRAEAEEVLRHFCDHGKGSPRVRWAPVR